MSVVVSCFCRWLLIPIAGIFKEGILTTLSEEPLTIKVVHPIVDRHWCKFKSLIVSICG